MKRQLGNLEMTDHIWGINPEAIFVFISDIERGTNDLEVVSKLETIRTDFSLSRDDYVLALTHFCQDLGFLKDGKLSPLGRILLADKDPSPMIQACLVSKDYRIRGFITDMINCGTQNLDRSEFETYFPGEGTCYSRLLASFDFLTLTEKSAHINLALVERVGKIRNFPRKVENWLCGKAFVEGLLGKNDDALVSELTWELLGILNVPYEKGNQDLSLFEAIKHLANKVDDVLQIIAADSAPTIDAVRQVIGRHSEENKSILSCMLEASSRENTRTDLCSISEKKLRSIASKYDIEETEFATGIKRIVFLQHTFPQIYLPYLQNFVHIEPKILIEVLAEAFGNNVRMDSYSIRFIRRIPITQDSGDREDYLRFILEAYSKNQGLIRKLASVQDYLMGKGKPFGEVIESNSSNAKNSMLKRVLSRKVSPFYFVYTLPDPDRLGKETIDRYVDKCEELQREVYRLRDEWPSIRAANSFSYSDMADRLFSKGLETELPTKEIRIMTPYTDYELVKYVSMLRRLIAKGYTLHILCRLHSRSEPWRIFKEGLLKGLGEKGTSVRIRTYTRFKQFLPAGKLAKLDERQRKQFGVHAKLFMIGDADNGAVLLGSANLLENSYSWNPECGLFTEDRAFIEAAKTFFDFVWKLSENDTLDLSTLNKIPKGPFFPRFYSR